MAIVYCRGGGVPGRKRLPLPVRAPVGAPMPIRRRYFMYRDGRVTAFSEGLQRRNKAVSFRSRPICEWLRMRVLAIVTGRAAFGIA